MQNIFIRNGLALQKVEFVCLEKVTHDTHDLSVSFHLLSFKEILKIVAHLAWPKGHFSTCFLLNENNF